MKIKTIAWMNLIIGMLLIVTIIFEMIEPIMPRFYMPAAGLLAGGCIMYFGMVMSDGNRNNYLH